MRDLTTYLDLAKARQGLASDNQLAHAWQVRRQSIHDYRNGIAMPRGDKMLDLAEMAGIDAKEAYLEWSIWQADHGRQRRAGELGRDLLRLVQSGQVSKRLGRAKGVCDPENV